MMSFMFIAGLVGFAAGASLIIIARRRFVDCAPYCAKCKYNLTGLTTNNCPECGEAMTATAARFRRRATRRGIVIPGALLLLAGLALLGVETIQWSRAVDWYAKAPLPVLRWLAQDGSRGATRELSKRVRAGQLTDDQLTTLAPWALDLLADRKTGADLGGELIHVLDERDLLTQAQQHRMFELIGGFELVCRPEVLLGEPIYCEAITRGYGAYETAYRMGFEVAGIRANGLEQKRQRYMQSMTPSSGWMMPAELRPITDYGDQPGKVNIEVELELRMYVDLHYGNSDPIWTQPRVLCATTDVLPADSPDPVKAVDNPALVTWVAQLLVDYVHVEPFGSSGQSTLHVSISHSVPALEDCPLEIVATGGPTEFKGSVLFGKGTSGPIAWINGLQFQPRLNTDVKDNWPAKVRLFVRPSRSWALYTTDMFELWQGEVDLGEYEVDYSQIRHLWNETADVE